MLTPKLGVLKDMYNQLRKYNALYKADLTHWSHEQGMFEAGEYFMQPGIISYQPRRPLDFRL